jgi:TetR/AcrR family transcriptional regulator, copper-responsive repressor
MNVRRGRPPAYQKELALSALTETFRLHGYAATSLDALVAATGMNRPSLFAAFGNKHTMYLAALDHFRDMVRSRLQPELAAGRSLLGDMTAFYQRAIEHYCEGNALGCLLLSTALSDAPNDSEVRERLRQSIDEIEAAIGERVKRALAKEDADELHHSLTKILLSQLIALSAQARMGVPEEQLRHAIGLVLSAILPPDDEAPSEQTCI